ncbi:hypothetical protein J7M23_08810 [Candidatus Sumerlaeota bacterium]|nr:hypothetical protein [Candidatus Sumerlaeota bacterium]
MSREKLTSIAIVALIFPGLRLLKESGKGSPLKKSPECEFVSRFEETREPG